MSDKDGRDILTSLDDKEHPRSNLDSGKKRERSEILQPNDLQVLETEKLLPKENQESVCAPPREISTTVTTAPGYNLSTKIFMKDPHNVDGENNYFGCVACFDPASLECYPKEHQRAF